MMMKLSQVNKQESCIILCDYCLCLNTTNGKNTKFGELLHHTIPQIQY